MQSNIDLIKTELKNVGFKNQNLINAITAVIGKESRFKPQSENLNYTASQLQKTFNLPQNEALQLAKNPINIANRVYGGKYGNNTVNDGWIYRGRGFNQITFKNSYNKYGKALGIDLIKNPDLLNRPDIAAKAAAIFFRDSLNNNKALIKKKYGIDINNISNLTPAAKLLQLATNANAGFGASDAIVKSEYNKALKYFQGNKSKIILPLLAVALVALWLNRN